MAMKFEEYKKAYETASAAIDGCFEAIKKNERVVGQTAGIIKEGAREIGLRIQQLEDGGATGNDLPAFVADPEVKKMVASVEGFLGSLDKEPKAVAAVHATTKGKSIAAFWSTRTELEAEIRSRKKSVTTKLDIGNKSLPDMETLLAEMDKYQNSASFVGVDAFEPETADQHRKEFGFAVKDEIAKTKGQKLSAEQAMYDEQALNERTLAKNLNLAKLAVEMARAAEKLAVEAAQKKDAATLKAQQLVVAESLKQLADLNGIFVARSRTNGCAAR